MSTVTHPTDLLERSDPLETLSRLLAEVASTSGGRLALIRGEAGIGKTALVGGFCDEQRDARILRGACDALFTPRPLGPFLDVAHAVGGELQQLATSKPKPYELATALLAELANADAHRPRASRTSMADEATVDVLRIVGAPDRELPGAHPGHVPGRRARSASPAARLARRAQPGRPEQENRPAAAFAGAVAVLARAYHFDPADLYRKTNGNPFFVTEALAAGTAGVPDTVRDAVLARAARLTPTGRELIDAVSIASPHAELWLLERLAPDALGCLEECVTGDAPEPRRRRLVPSRTIASRNRAFTAARSTPHPASRSAGHAREPPDGNLDLARLAHHAEAAGDAPQ